MNARIIFSAFLAMSLSISSISARPRESVTDITADVQYSIKNGDQSMTAYSALWDGEFNKTNWEVVVGYVNKSWRCTYSSISQREDFFGDPDDRYFHGFQLGGLYTPSFDWGLGMRTGLFLEFYTSRSKWITDWCRNFAEFDLYIPLHASYRIPFDSDSCLNLFGGMGFQWAASGRYLKQVGTAWTWWRRPVPIYASEKQEYGNGWPKAVNWQAECGVNVRYKRFLLSFTYSFGIIDHGIENSFDGGKTFETAIKSRQDKMQASIAFLFY